MARRVAKHLLGAELDSELPGFSGSAGKRDLGKARDHAGCHPPMTGRKYSEVLWQGRWCLLLQSVIVICAARRVAALAVGVGLLELGEPKCVRELVELCR